MERLLADAEAYRASMGETVEYEITNLADVYTAIGDIQEKLGIAGTTAKEASTTISGSANQMKAAWEDMLVSISDGKGDLGRAVQNFTNTVEIFFLNLVPVVEQAMGALGDVIGAVAPGIVAKITEMLVKAIPSLVQVVGAMVRAAITGIFEGLGSLFMGETSSKPQIQKDIEDKIQKPVENTQTKIESTTEAVKELKKSLLSFDELNILGSEMVETSALDSLPSINTTVDISDAMQGLVGTTDDLTKALDDSYSALDTWIGAGVVLSPLVSRIIGLFKGKNKHLKDQTKSTWADAVGVSALAALFGLAADKLLGKNGEKGLNEGLEGANEGLLAQSDALGDGALAADWELFAQRVSEGVPVIEAMREATQQVTDKLVVEAEAVVNTGEAFDAKYVTALDNAITKESEFYNSYGSYVVPVFDGIIDKVGQVIDAIDKLAIKMQELDPTPIPTPIPTSDIDVESLPDVKDIDWFATEGIEEEKIPISFPEAWKLKTPTETENALDLLGLGNAPGWAKTFAGGVIDVGQGMAFGVKGISNDMAEGVKDIAEVVKYVLESQTSEVAQEVWKGVIEALRLGVSWKTGFPIPAMATGAVIPPNRPFMGIFGDQKYGNNLEAPESLIRQIVREETAGIAQGVDVNVNFTGTEARLIQYLSPKISVANRYRGKNIITGDQT